MFQPVMTQRLFCYVDESGQDSTAHSKRERIFIVAVAVFDRDREAIEQACEQFERVSGKGRRKWNKCNVESRMTYWQLILSDERFKHTLCYSRHVPPLRPEFDARTILSIAKAVQWKQPQLNYTTDIFVDGISEAKQIEFANELRQVGVHVRRVHRARDESQALIRLADALAGLAREAAEGNETSMLLLQKALRRGFVTEL